MEEFKTATITTAGLAAIAQLINNASVINPFTYMANGLSSAAESAANTTLGTENTQYGAERKAATCTYQATGISQWVALFTFNNNVTIREVAIFNAATTGGTMLFRHVLSGDKLYGPGESVQITVTTTIAAV